MLIHYHTNYVISKINFPTAQKKNALRNMGLKFYLMIYPTSKKCKSLFITFEMSVEAQE